MFKKTQQTAEWTCPACTLINPVENRVCSACDHELKQPKKLVNLIPNLIDRNSNNNNNTNNNNASNSKYSNLRSTFNNLSMDVKGFILNSFNGSNNNNNNNNNTNENEMTDEIIEIDPRTNRPVGVRKQSAEPKLISNNMWVCKRCSYSTNPKWRTKCEMCLYEEADTSRQKNPPDGASYNDSTPSSSENDNKKSDVDDSMSFTTVYDKSLTEDIYDYARIWTCKFCTFINFVKISSVSCV